MTSVRPLLVFDSGVGGLSVLGAIRALLPSAPLVYAADSAGYPYGTKRPAEIEAGKRLLLGVSSVGDADAKGMRTVMCTLNGQFRPITVRAASIQVDVKAAEKAEPGNPSHVPAPFAGGVTPAVAEGDTVAAGDVVATIEAMKMEANITAPRAGTVERLAIIGGHQQVEGGDLLLVLKG